MITAQKIVDNTETTQLATDMNDILGIYFPSDTDDDVTLRQFDELFVLFRQLYFLYDAIEKEEVTQIFVDFYNQPRYSEREAILNSLRARIEFEVELYAQLLEENPDMINANIIDAYLEQPDEESQACLLYFLVNGYLPNPEESLLMYTEMAKEIQRSLVEYETERELQNQPQFQPHSDAITEAPTEDLTPEQVVSRYLKGSGLYDPSMRNSGFRVDTDIEGPNRPQV